MADGRRDTESAFLIPNSSLSREGDRGWHAEGDECKAYGNHVHPRSRPPLIVWAPRAGIDPEEAPVGTMIHPGHFIDEVAPQHPVPRWEVRVSHYREDGSVATQVKTLSETELAARRLPIGPWSAIRAIAGALVSQIEHAERRRG